MDKSDNGDALRNSYNSREVAEGEETENANPTTSSAAQQKDCTSSSTLSSASGTGTAATSNGLVESSERKSGKISSSSFGDYKNIRATCGESSPQPEQFVRREENPFSFKHFLSRDTSTNSPSSSITSNSNNVSTSSSASTKPPASSYCLQNDLVESHSIHNHVHSSNSNHTPAASSSSSPPAAVAATTSSSSLSSVSSYQTSTGARPKVPQSSSVSTTSMSSLAGGGTDAAASSSSTRMKRSPRFSSFDSQASLAEYTTGDANQDPSSSSGFRPDMTPFGVHLVSSTDQELFGDSRYDNSSVQRSFSNYDMGLPCDRSSPRRKISPARPNRLGVIFPQGSNSNNPSSSGRPAIAEFVAAALPDFVQDHWMDPWNGSRPNSPISPVNLDLPDLPGPSMSSADKCQTLPDFLSDGPIIHSSGRLADVASGLPDLDSPEDDSPTMIMSRLHLENERLRRELDEARLSLADQTRRAGDLERVLEQTRNSESAYNRTLAQNIGLVEENLDQSKKRTAAAQNQVSKLKQQVKQLTAEVETLRRENESLREEGAVGGREREPRRPSRTQQLSRDLMHAAANAENNLRQLLHGVENLRVMAVAIENMDSLEFESPTNPGGHHIGDDDFLSDCDDFDEYTGGPAL